VKVKPGDKITASIVDRGLDTHWSLNDDRNGRTVWTHSSLWPTRYQHRHTAECIVESPELENGHGTLAQLAQFGTVQFSNCQAVDQSGTVWDMVGKVLPAHWIASELEMKPAKTIIAVPSLNPLTVTRVGPAPALAWTTASAIRLRTPAGTIRTLMTLRRGEGASALVFSADGRFLAWVTGIWESTRIVAQMWVANVATGTATDVDPTCDCQSAAFAGDTLYTDGPLDEPGKELERVPLKPGPLMPISLSGMPASQRARGDLIVQPGASGRALFAEPQSGSWTKRESAYGGPDNLWEAKSNDSAARLVDDQGNAIPTAALLDRTGKRLLYVGVAHNGFCDDGDYLTLVDLKTGKVTPLSNPPARPGIVWYVDNISFGSGGVPEATMVNSEATCGTSAGSVSSREVTPRLYIFDHGSWQVAEPAMQVASSAGWNAVLDGHLVEDITGAGQETLPGNVLSLIAPWGGRIRLAADVGQFALDPSSDLSQK